MLDFIGKLGRFILECVVVAIIIILVLCMIGKYHSGRGGYYEQPVPTQKEWLQDWSQKEIVVEHRTVGVPAVRYRVTQEVQYQGCPYCGK